MKSRDLSLKSIFTTSLVIVILISAGIIAFFSFFYGQKAIEEVVDQLIAKIADSVQTELLSFLSIPPVIVEQNVRSVQKGILDINNPTALELHFWNQVHVYPGISPIYLGYAQGGVSMALRREVAQTGRLSDDVKISTSHGKEADAQYMYFTDEFGNLLNLYEKYPNYDVRKRPWFKEAVKREEAGWSPIFINFGGDALVISRSAPIYDNDGQLLAVTCADLNLTYISDFLRGLTIGENGRGFIIDQSTNLVATSSSEDPLKKVEGNVKPIRLTVAESRDNLIRSSAKFIDNYLRTDETSSRQGFFRNQDLEYRMLIRPFRLKNGPDLWICIVIPESDVMATIKRNNHIAISIILGAMIVSLIIGVLLSNWLTSPIRMLSNAAIKVAEGDLTNISGHTQPNEIFENQPKSFREVNALSDSFRSMMNAIHVRTAALEKSREFNYAVLSSLNDNIAVLDKEGIILSVNQSWNNFARNNEVSSLEMVGEGINYLEVCQGVSDESAEIAQGAHRGIKSVLSGERNVFELEYPCNSPKEERWFLLRVIPFSGEKGAAIVSHSDISDRKKAEIELLEAELKYRTIADFAYDWEYWEAQDSSLVYVSPSCERITHYRVSDFLERPELLSEIIVPEDQEIWNSHRHGENIDETQISCRFRIKRKDGEIRWIAHVCQPVYTAEGDFNGIRSSNRDITELQKAESIASEHLIMIANQDRRATLGQLTGSIAHELNQPLTGILAGAQAGEMLLEQERFDQAQLIDIFSDIVSDTKRASKVIQNLRELFGGKTVTMTSVNINSLILDTLKLLNSEIISNDVIIQTDLLTDGKDVVANRIQLQQVLINLIRNACESMKNDDKQDRWLSIKTTYAQENQLELSIADNGTGIDPDHMESIFDPLSQAIKGGMGMGLPICKSIVRAHKGEIWVENIPKGGAKFIVTIPIDPELML